MMSDWGIKYLTIYTLIVCLLLITNDIVQAIKSEQKQDKKKKRKVCMWRVPLLVPTVIFLINIIYWQRW
ncbi:hypothetical protein [Clostridium cadaveris]|uniref:hypothetical protein n=1 Tax=Clostridium cadaveris TaxID=1529 RepID=UPI0015B3E00A|nr:hypothetical protein [Clostridium cadaveris]NWK11755.1 hypothetical protein [Clostridium cadaveris]